METNCFLVIGVFLLLVAVDFSTADSEANVSQVTSLDNQNVDVTVNPVKNTVLVDVGHQLKDVDGGIQSDTNQSNSKKQSGSNEGHLQKVGEESSDKTAEKMDAEKGDNGDEALEESSTESKVNTNGGQRVDNVHTGKEEPNVDDKQKADGEREGDHVHSGQEELNVDVKQKIDGEKQGKDVHKGQGDNEHTGREEPNADAKQKKDSEEHSDKVHMGQKEPNAEDNRMKDGDQQGDQRKNQEESSINTEGKQYSQEMETLGDGVHTNGVNKGKYNSADSIPPPATRNEGFHGEECDSSNMCMDKNKRFAACLRVPGNESPELSLLIRNKGKGPLTIKISAPAFVQLGEKLVGLQEKEDKEVKVSIKNYGTGNLIVLKDDVGECSLDFKEFVVHGSANSYINALSQTPATILIFFAAILILALGWLCINLKQKHFAKSGLKYRKLDMELPVFAKVKSKPNVDDEWDNSWGDSWDDEEAPMTPSKPVTPSLSSKGLASRRLSKEGWKD